MYVEVEMQCKLVQNGQLIGEPAGDSPLVLFPFQDDKLRELLGRSPRVAFTAIVRRFSIGNNWSPFNGFAQYSLTARNKALYLWRAPSLTSEHLILRKKVGRQHAKHQG
jgi:hypothetical protein